MKTTIIPITINERGFRKLFIGAGSDTRVSAVVSETGSLFVSELVVSSVTSELVSMLSTSFDDSESDFEEL